MQWQHREVKRVLQRYHELQDIMAILGMDELSDDEKTLVARALESSSSYHRTSMWQSSLPASQVLMYQ